MGYKSVIKFAALGAALSLAFFGGKLAVLAAGSIGVASATVVGSARLGDVPEIGELRIRLPGLAALSRLAATADPSERERTYHGQPVFDAVIKRQCGDGNSCCNPSFNDRLEGNPTNSLSLSLAQLEKNVRCQITVMYN